MAKDRHKGRKVVHLSEQHHAQLTILAKRRGRPLNWLLQELAEDALRKAKLWPPPENSE